MNRIALAIFYCFAFAHAVTAAEKPRESPANHRQMFAERLSRDIADTHGKAVPHAFSDEDRRRAKAASNPDAITIFRISDADIELLYEYYNRVRNRVREDVLEIKNRAKHGEPTDAEIEQWESDRAELAKLGAELAAKSEGVRRLARLIYASVPGYALREYEMLPQMYYILNEDTGGLEYLGPASETALDEMADVAIMADSPLYVLWVDVNRDLYNRWLKKHHDLYDRLVKKEPKIAEAVRGEPPPKTISSHVTSGNGSQGSTGTSSHGSGGTWAHPAAETDRPQAIASSRDADHTADWDRIWNAH